MSDVFQLADELEAINPELISFRVEFYESNSVFLNNKNSFDTWLELETYLLIVINYASNLISLGNYNRAIEQLVRIENINDKFNGQFHSNSTVNNYKILIHQWKGIAYYRLEEFDDALDEINEALQYDPNNDALKLYLKRIKKYKSNKRVNYYYLVGMILFALELLSKDIFTHEFRYFLLISGVCVVIYAYLKSIK